MGAFGRYLIQTMGGNLKSYDNADSIYHEPKKETDDMLIEREEIMLAQVKQVAKNLMEQGELMIKQLRDEDHKINTELFTTKKVQKDFYEWRDKFLNKINNLK